MNCIILLLLLSCCSGWGNSSCGCGTNAGCPSDRRNTGRGDSCRENSGRRGNERNNNDRRGNERRDMDRTPEDCGCKEEKPVHEHNDCGCEGERENRETRGIIPPPWQEYPGFPRRDDKDDGDDCES